MKNTLTFILLIVFANIQASDLIEKLSPEIGESKLFYIGEKIFQSSKGYIKPCIVPKKEFNRKQGMSHRYIYKQDVPICKENIKSKFYESPYINADSGFGTMKQPVVIKKNKKGYTICQKGITRISEGCIKDISEEEIIVDDNYLNISSNYPSRSITYLGKSKSILKFLYEERYTNAFSSFESAPVSVFAGNERSINFEIDTEESTTILFMGGIFEILEFDTSSINIKSIRNFQ
tara:strand:- start:843 stop:1544 length:702 start_codon:yes stop_codon:yes gene_type:complete